MDKTQQNPAGFLEGLFRALPFFGLGAPTDPHKVPLIEGTPDGLRPLYTAPTLVEADLLRQVLIDAGFHIEYVPQTTMGIFGIRGSTRIFVRADEYQQALEFLNEYLSGAPEETS